MQGQSKVPDWLVWLVNAPRYRWRAAAYGIQIRFSQPAFEQLRLALVAIGLMVAGVGVSQALPHLAPTAWVGLAAGLALAAVLAARYLGNLARIMHIAAWSEDGAARIRGDMALGMQNDLVYRQLIELYRPIVEEINGDLAGRGVHRSLNLVELEGARGGRERYAAVCLAAEGSDSLEDLFGEIEPRGQRWSPQRFRGMAESRQRLMRKWRSMDRPDRPMEDERGDNYCMTELTVNADDPIRLQVGVATYGEIVRSCDALINELALFAYLTGALGRRWRMSPFRRGPLRMSPAGMLRRLPWRNRIHRECRARPLDFRLRRAGWQGKGRRAEDLFMRPRNRAAGVGLAVVTLDRRESEEEVAYLGMRSGQVGTYPATNHVVPAGMCNTYGTQFSAESNGGRPAPDYLRTAMRCEFLEEWFREKELEGNKRRNWSKRVNAKWEAIRRRPPFGRGTSPITEDMGFTGIAFDLLNLRPEVCATAVVDTSDGELNWEFDEIGAQGPLETMYRISRTEIVQSGAAALMLAQASRRGPRSRLAEDAREEPA